MIAILPVATAQVGWVILTEGAPGVCGCAFIVISDPDVLHVLFVAAN